MKHNEKRRSVLKNIGMGMAGLFGLATVKAASPKSKKEVVGKIVEDQNMPLFSGAVRHGNTLYIAGKGAHFDGDIKAHTDHVLNELQKELEREVDIEEVKSKLKNHLSNLFEMELI